MKGTKRAATCAVVVLLAVFAFSIISQQSAGVAALPPDYKPTPAAVSAANNETVLRVSDLKNLYPDVYASYMAGNFAAKEKDGEPHSHAGLREAVESGTGIYETFNGGIGCLACKTSDLNRLYEKYGQDVWGMNYVDLAPEVIDYWDCYLCHQNDPMGTVGAMSLSYQELAGAYLHTLSPGDAACGQCHSIVGGYTRRLVSLPGQSLETLDPYRYGTHADAIIKAFLEDGDTLVRDSDGVEFFYAGHPDVEIFQGSNHQSQGLSCPSCHMITETNPITGKQYISHDASGSPLASDTALKYCLTCHESQGITNIGDMSALVKSKQSALWDQSEAVGEKLKELHALIVAGSGDAKIDAEARQLYITARWYKGYADGDADVPGAKAVHAFNEMSDYYTDALALAKEGIALFGK